jgi:hypothetical protein
MPEHLVELPEFFWSDADSFKRTWSPTGAPELGKAWYGPLRGRIGTEHALQAQIAALPGLWRLQEGTGAQPKDPQRRQKRLSPAAAAANHAA